MAATEDSAVVMEADSEAVTAAPTDFTAEEAMDSTVEAMDSTVEAMDSMVEAVDSMVETMGTTEDTTDTIGIMGMDTTAAAGGTRGSSV